MSVLQLAHLPRKPMRYTPVIRRDYRGKPCLFWRHNGQVSYIFANEYHRYIRDQKKRIGNQEVSAEYWRSIADLALIPNADPEREQIEHEAQTWHRFATTTHAF